MTDNSSPVTLTERITDWQHLVTVDRDTRFIRNVALAGIQSRNGYVYSPQALRDAIPLYEQKPVFLDHSADKSRSLARSTRDLAGTVTNVRFDEQRIRGDIKVLDTLAGQTLLALAEADTPGIGMSHVVLAERNSATRTVDRILDVVSVDAVINPATTSSFQESLTPELTSPRGPRELVHAAQHPPLIQEIQELRADRQELEHQLALLANELRQLQEQFEIRTLVDQSRLPVEALSEQFLQQLLAAPNQQARRKLIHQRAQCYREQNPLMPRSVTRQQAATSLPDDTFISAIRRL